MANKRSERTCLLYGAFRGATISARQDDTPRGGWEWRFAPEKWALLFAAPPESDTGIKSIKLQDKYRGISSNVQSVSYVFACQREAFLVPLSKRK